MPRMDGYELCRQLRALETTRSVPIILVTAAGNLTRVLEGFAAGADDYVTKPFHARELLARVDVHAKLRSLIREVAQRERLATLGNLAASVAHQVRNPLTALVSGLPAMRRRLADKIDAPSIDMLDTMLDCSERIQRITNDLLDLSRVDRAEVATFKPGEGLASAVRLVATRLDGRDMSLDVEIDGNTELRGRPGDMNQVFMNLLDNAARAVASGGVIRVRAELARGMYVVKVEDSGAGVAPSDRELVFEPFWTSRPPGQGTGLGLSLALTVVEQHSGRIELGSSSLGGACFTVTLPISRDSQRPPPTPL
jgi:signal transduction histidine kinase